MKTMVKYRVRAERAAENEAAIRRVFAELGRAAPPGLCYAAFKLDDGMSFVHLVSMEAGKENPLAALAAFQAFAAGVGERCDETPRAQRLDEIGSYRIFSDKEQTS